MLFTQILAILHLFKIFILHTAHVQQFLLNMWTDVTSHYILNQLLSLCVYVFLSMKRKNIYTKVYRSRLEVSIKFVFIGQFYYIRNKDEKNSTTAADIFCSFGSATNCFLLSAIWLSYTWCLRRNFLTILHLSLLTCNELSIFASYCMLNYPCSLLFSSLQQVNKLSTKWIQTKTDLNRSLIKWAVKWIINRCNCAWLHSTRMTTIPNSLIG